MSDFAAMQSRIADELGDVDEAEFTSNIKAHIVDAIAHYERQRFWFNERIGSFNTVASQEAYDWPANQLTIDTLKLTISQDPYMLIQRDWRAFDDMRVSSGTSAGAPTDWAIYGDQIYLYPIPEQAYLVTYSGLYQPADVLTTASDGADTNAWMTTAAALIRGRAKMTLARGVLRDPELMALARDEEAEALSQLRYQSAKRTGSRRIRAHGLAGAA